MHVREKPPLRQHIDAVTPSGRHYRWGEDEPLPENVFGDLRHSSTMPGGYESCEVTLPRKPGVDYSDLERLTTLRVMGAGGQVDGEYRLERAPRVSGDQVAISPQAVGWQAHLDDDKSAREVYRDASLSNWRGPGTTRRLALAANPSTIGDMATGNNPASAAALILSIQGAWSAASGFSAEGYYEAPAGVTISRLFATWATNTNIGVGGGNWRLLGASSADEVSFPELTADLLTGAASTGQITFVPTTARKMVAVLLANTLAGGGDLNYELFLTDVAVYGDHGLTLRTTDPNAGFCASDIVGHAVAKYAPLLTLKSDSIQQSSFIIPHLVFLESTTCAEIVRQASRFNLPDWAVWDDKEFQWFERGTRGKRWRARIGPSQLEETGPQLDRLWNGIVVSYQDPDGTTKTVGPTGSGADTESTDVVDSDPENPANKLGIRRWDQLQMGVSTAAGATEIGRRFLEQTKVLDSSGRAQIVGWVEDDRGVSYPYSRVRAGDSISFVDASDTSYRRIVRADHTRSSRSCSIDLDAPPDGLQALLERLGVVLVPLGV